MFEKRVFLSINILEGVYGGSPFNKLKNQFIHALGIVTIFKIITINPFFQL